MAKTILVASGKGGTGKTSVCSHIATDFAKKDLKVLLIDTDCGFKGLDLVLGLSDKVLFNFNDVLNGTVSIKDAVVFSEDLPKLHLLSAPQKQISRDFAVSHIAKMIDTVFDVYDYIFIDCSAGFAYETEIFAQIAHAGIVVCTPDSTSLRGGENMARQLEHLGLLDVYLVLNRVRTKLILKNKASNIDDAIDTTFLPLIGIIPEDEYVISCGNEGITVFNIAKSQSSIAYKNISNRLLGRQVNIMNLK